MATILEDIIAFSERPRFSHIVFVQILTHFSFYHTKQHHMCDESSDKIQISTSAWKDS